MAGLSADLRAAAHEIWDALSTATRSSAESGTAR